MTYYTGAANSFEHLQAALFSACEDSGWTLTGQIITKGDLAIKAVVNNVSEAFKGIGLIIQGGDGISGTAVTNPSPITPRMGPPSYTGDQPTWPMEYFIHVFTDPDEVYLVAKFSVDFHYFLAFGKSTVPGLGGNGLWLSATAMVARGNPTGAINMGVGSGGSANNSSSSGAIFWNTLGTGPNSANDTCMVGLDGVTWSGTAYAWAVGALNALHWNTSFMSRQPNAWNSEAILNRIQPLFWYTGNKCAVVADLDNARYIRIDNFAPGQIISIGSEQWKIYPFYRKNSASRDGGSNVNHTGTFGWAIRYDGP